METELCGHLKAVSFLHTKKLFSIVAEWTEILFNADYLIR